MFHHFCCRLFVLLVFINSYLILFLFLFTVLFIISCQVLLERDQAQKEASSLFAELEALKDHNVQLADRAANYIVQAKAKEVGINTAIATPSQSNI